MFLVKKCSLCKEIVADKTKNRLSELCAPTACFFFVVSDRYSGYSYLSYLVRTRLEIEGDTLLVNLLICLVVYSHIL
jgi:hypothetical protein